MDPQQNFQIRFTIYFVNAICLFFAIQNTSNQTFRLLGTHPMLFTLAGTDLLCMLNWGTQWTMVSYLKK